MAKTIDERVQEIENAIYENHFVPDARDFGERQGLRHALGLRLKSALLAVARDQQERDAHLCDCIADDHGGKYMDTGSVADECATAIRAASIEGE